MSGIWVTSVIRHIRMLANGRGRGRGRHAQGQSDESLLEQFVSQRDETAFAAMMQRHGPMTMGVCVRILRDQHLAEDAFQATFLVLALKADAIRKRGSVASWLYGVASRLARKLKANAHRSRLSFGGEQDPPALPLRDTPMEAGWREELALLDEELARLPDRYRLPLLLCYFEGRTQEEAAAELGWTAGKVKGLLDRGRERLRFRLLRRGVTLSALLTTALCAAVPPLLAASTAQAALKLAAGQPLTGCGVSAMVANLTRKGLFMSAKRPILIMAFMLLTCALGALTAAWAIEPGNEPAALSTSVPDLEPKAKAKPEDNLPAILQTSKPAKADDLEFQIVSRSIWPMPAAAGSSGVQFQLKVANRGKKDVVFLPVVGKPILQTADGKEVPMKMSGRNHLRVLPKPVTIEAGKSLTVGGSAAMGTYNKKTAIGWEDETGMVWSIGGGDLTPGKYLFSLQYRTAELGYDDKSVAKTGSWLGDVRTAPVSVEIVDLKAFAPAVTNGLEVVPLTDAAWQAPAMGKQTQVCLGFRIRTVDKPKYYPWIVPAMASVSIKSADGTELPARKTTATVAVFEPQMMVIRPEENYSVANPAVLFRAGKTLTLAWADAAGNVWQIDNLTPGQYSVRYVVHCGKGSESRPISLDRRPAHGNFYG